MTEQKKTVFLTGGSRGIGAAIAKNLAKGGFDIWLNYHSSQKAAKNLQKEIQDLGRECKLLAFDVADEKKTLAIMEPLLDEYTPFAFVHNAGITRDTLLAMMKREEWDQVIDVHLNSFFTLAKLFSKAMIRARQGRIIAISSVSGETGQAGQVNYSAAKAGLIGACKALARELARRNILVNVVSPGLIDTDMIKDTPLERVLPMIPLNRPGTVDEVAGLVRFLMGAEAGYITGQVIGVNGGLYM